jgi:hypothetical protein
VCSSGRVSYTGLDHGGGLPSYVSGVWIFPDLELGIAALTNQETGEALDAIFYRIADRRRVLRSRPAMNPTPQREFWNGNAVGARRACYDPRAMPDPMPDLNCPRGGRPMPYIDVALVRPEWKAPTRVLRVSVCAAWDVSPDRHERSRCRPATAGRNNRRPLAFHYSQGGSPMMETRFVAIVAAALCAAACGTATPTAPSAMAESVVPLDKNVGESCSVDVGPTEYPLPAVHGMEGFLNASLEDPGSSVNCGQVRSLDGMLEGVANALDEASPNYDRACGASGALLNKLESLIHTGVLATPTFPDPGDPTRLITVLDAAQFLNGRWCAAAAGEIPDPGR